MWPRKLWKGESKYAQPFRIFSSDNFIKFDKLLFIFVLYNYMKTLEKPISVARLGLSRQIAIPKKLHDELGLEPGDYFEVTREEDMIVFKPKVLMDKTIQKRLEKAEKAYKKGKYKGPFKSASAVLLAVKQSRHEGHSH